MPKNPDFSLAQIYTIRSKKDAGFIYVGTSCRDLAQVLAKHWCDSKKKTNVLYDRIAGNWDDYYLQLHEQYPCENAQQLRDREHALKLELGAFSNKLDPETRKRNMALYYKDHKEQIAERVKAYYTNHKRHERNAYHRAYRARKKAEGKE